MITLSVIKADVGGYPGHSRVHPDLLDKARECVEQAKHQGLLVDAHVMRVGDDLQLIMTHQRGTNDTNIHHFAWDTFETCAEVAKRLKLYGAGQDLLADAFSGNIRGMGPGCAEMEFEERRSEPVLVFMADKTAAGAWNLPLYRMFADPFNTAGLVIANTMHDGFRFEVHDILKHQKIFLDTPEEMYDLLMFIGAPNRYCVKAVYARADGDIAAVSSTEKLSLIAGRYVGKDDPVMAVRCQGTFPALGEVLEPFSLPHLVAGWMRGSHCGPLMPVAFHQANPSRFDGPPRVIAAGFQIADGLLIGPVDMFDDPSFDLARQQANQIAEYMRRHGPFEPHRLSLEELEYTTMPQIMAKLTERWEPLEAAKPTAQVGTH
ncbi:MAG: fructose 1,6-bisphosphatase [Chloroflexi bacterium]|nr:fructose 1,6-bisphosphatase [Chloroflexota bacterium]